MFNHIRSCVTLNFDSLTSKCHKVHLCPQVHLSCKCGHGRLSTDDPPTTQLRPHNRRTGQSPLASHPRAHSVQGRSPRVQSVSWTRDTVSRTTDSRLQLTSSTCTPFGRHESTGYTVCSIVDCQRSGIRRCWPANLEVCQLTWSQQRLLPRSDRHSQHFCLKIQLACSGPSSRLCYLGHFKGHYLGHLLLDWLIDWSNCNSEIEMHIHRYRHLGISGTAVFRASLVHTVAMGMRPRLWRMCTMDRPNRFYPAAHKPASLARSPL